MISGPARNAQRGQALVFVTIVILAVLLALVTMFSMGQLTTEKMRLQNTADAAAYSAAVAQARDYNFSAYTNRAMIANQVAMAQLVGLTAWVRNYDDTFRTLTPQVSWMARGAVANILWTPFVSALKGISSGLKSGFNSVAPGVAKALQLIIDALGIGQSVYHYGTAVTVAQTLGVDNKFNTILGNLTGFDLSGLTGLITFGNTYDVVKLNDPNASISLLGLIGFAYNTYKWFGFTEAKDPTLAKGSAKGDGTNSERFAKVTTSSMDGFYDIRTRPYVPFPWPLPSVLVDPTFLVGGPMVYGFTMLLFHNGGTELRNNNKTWSAMDVTSFFGLVTIPIFIPPFGPFINLPILPWVIPPFGAGAGGAAQAGTSNAISSSGNFNRDNPAGNKSAADVYGNSYSANAIAAAMQQGKGAGTSLATSGGLRKYREVADTVQVTDTDHQNTSSPPIILEIEKPSSSITTSATGNLRIGRGGSSDATSFCSLTSTMRNAPPVTTTFGQGNLDVGDGTASNCMRAMSKAEAYFSRPTDLFARGDGKTEYGSLYNPYWQARLLPNTTLEQAVSLLFQGLNFSSVASAWEGSTFQSWVN
ncbi:MAG: hypothetical protein JWN94_1295 [Betaproteobacteria bacterium]|nr:hypothetical protein [Betaproteobacteria bacterium]